MKTISHVFLLLGAVFCYGCGSPCKPHASLDVIIDSSYKNFILMGMLSNEEDTAIEGSHIFENGAVLFHWDSLPSGEYLFTIPTLFSKQQKILISHCDNDTIRPVNEFSFHQTDLITKEQLKNADTIEFALVIQGCFHHYIERSLLVKNKTKDGYHLVTAFTGMIDEKQHIDKNVSPGIIDAIYKVQAESKVHADSIDHWNKASITCMSTTTTFFYILANNQVYGVSDQGICNWNMYEAVRKIYEE